MFDVVYVNKQVKKNEEEFKMELSKPIPICGDIKIDFFHKDRFKKVRSYVFRSQHVASGALHQLLVQKV